MRTFVAGGTGVVGTRAVPALVAAGHDVSVVARSPEKAALVRSLGGEAVAVDLFDAAAVTEAVDGHEAVVNMATHVPPLTRALWPGAWATNDRLRTEASAHLVDAALATGASRFVQESICLPYLDRDDEWIDEDDHVGHVGPFAAVAHAEAAAQRFTDGGGTGVVLRFAQFYAHDSRHTATFNSFVRRRINPLMGDPGDYTSFVHAEDAGAAVVAALDAPAGVYNVADDEPVTKREAGRIIADTLGVKPPRSMPKLLRVASPPSAKLLMRSQRISHDRFTAATGWTPTRRSIRDAWPTRMAA